MNLSSSQKELLKNLIDGKEAEVFSKRTISALQRRGLINESNILTESGNLEALELIPLKKQCQYLSLDFTELKVNSIANPEYQSFQWFKKQGYDGAYCEGGAILTILKALTLDKLAELNYFNSREDACTRFLEAQFTILNDHKSEILQSILKIDENKFVENFSEIISYELVQEVYPDLSIQFAQLFVNKLSRKVFVFVADRLFEAPYKYRKGWPDLTLINEEEVRFVEVKTTDRLHQSQIQTIKQFSPLIPARFEVLKLTKR